VDYEENGFLNTTQIGQLLQVIGVFKYLFNEEYEKKMQSKSKQKPSSFDQFSSWQVKVEERKLREEEFLMQSWLLLNPRGTQYIDSQLVVEYLKLTYDPYVGSANQN